MSPSNLFLHAVRKALGDEWHVFELRTPKDAIGFVHRDITENGFRGGFVRLRHDGRTEIHDLRAGMIGVCRFPSTAKAMAQSCLD